MFTHRTALAYCIAFAHRMASTRAALMRRLFSDDDGAVTAEYAIATIAAVGFAALLVVVLRSDEVRGLLLGLIRHALSLPA